MKVTIDFETRSAVDIRDVGAWAYSEHPTTEPICLAVRPDNGPAGIWVNPKFFASWFVNELHPAFCSDESSPFLQTIHAADTVEAHNADFERAIWINIMAPRFSWRIPKLEKWRCSAAKVSAHALPRSLDGAGRALGLSTQKDAEGHRLMLKMCRPRKPRKGEPDGLYWYESPEELVRLLLYCLQDVKAEEEVSSVLDDLSKQEQEVWFMDRRMNERGIAVDVNSALKMTAFMQRVEKELMKETVEVSGGRVQSVKQVAALAEYCGVENVKVDTVAAALEGGGLPDDARRLLEIRQILGRASSAKYDKILDRACKDGRLRGELIYHGAGPGRWTGNGVQLQNLPRASYGLPETELAFRLLENFEFDWIENYFGDPTDFAKRLIRPLFRAGKGRKLVWVDYSQIEARVLFWLAGVEEGLDIFRSGIDPYCDMAGSIYDRPVTKADKMERQVGKIAFLGLGYGMAHKKFMLTCKANTGIDIERKLARKVVKTYRTRFSGVPEYWYANERCAVAAVKSGDEYPCGKAAWKMHERFLQCVLPSGRKLSYFDPQIDIVPSWIYPAIDEEGNNTSIMIIDTSKERGKRAAYQRAKEDELRIIGEPIEREKSILSYMGMVKGKWVREHTYGGKLVENIDQATARDIMAEAMLRAEKKGYPPVLSVHDEIITEPLERFGSVEELEHILIEAPPWAAGLPIAAEGVSAEKYRK
jgi:DNA polymerase bacteriophage-type